MGRSYRLSAGALGAAVLALLCLWCPRPVQAWHLRGHQLAALAAVEALPESMPAFFRDGAATVAHCAIDPDLWKDQRVPQLRAREDPEHYIDLELLRGRPVPANRYDFVRLTKRLRVNTEKVGLVPYAVAEGTQRLAVAFAEHRKFPENAHIRLKCLVYAGLLSHYAGDLCQPLHTTIHYDGRVRRRGGSSPQTGIHHQVDSLLEKLEPGRRDLEGVSVVAFADPMAAALAQMRNSHALVERVYELEPQLPAVGDPIESGSAVEGFASDRWRAAVSFLASLYRTAWEDSEGFELDRLERHDDPTTAIAAAR
jgi:hypothetical protein